MRSNGFIIIIITGSKSPKNTMRKGHALGGLTG